MPGAFAATAALPDGRGTLGGRLRRNLATQDLCCLAYHGYMLGRALEAPARPEGDAGLLQLLALFAVTVVTVLVVRGELMPAGRARAIFYRVGIMAPIVLAYVPLRYALKALALPLHDAQLCRIDELVLGQTPARHLERFVSPGAVEWFAFFYYSYFTLVALHVVGSALFDHGRRAAEVLFAAMAICCIGHTLYTLVPGVGPYAAMPFRQQLSGGFFFGLVQHTVASAGAMLDIFPSLHTAYPTLFTLHSWRYRRTLPYRYTLPVTAFFNLNIVIATLFLRWHYAIDVVAGLALAVLTQRLAIQVADRESSAARAASDRQAVWEPLLSR